jgi:large subunit ribosomal protein L18
MTFARRKKEKTDYAQRLALLKSGKPRVVIRRSLNNIRVQIILSEDGKDKTVAEGISKNLRKFGWKVHGGNMSSAYLTGFLVGLKAAKSGVSEAIVDLGLQKGSRGSSLFAAALGVKDAGVKVSVGKEAAPDKDRISGRHVAQYAEKLKKENMERYKKQFSLYLKEGIHPEDLPKHFEEVKAQIHSKKE